jgi:hypothetical protein
MRVHRELCLCDSLEEDSISECQEQSKQQKRTECRTEVNNLEPMYSTYILITSALSDSLDLGEVESWSFYHSRFDSPMSTTCNNYTKTGRNSVTKNHSAKQLSLLLQSQYLAFSKIERWNWRR